MVAQSRQLSIKYLFIGTVMGVTALAIVVTSAVSLLGHFNQLKQELSANVELIAELIGRNAVVSLTFDDQTTEMENLLDLASTDVINNVHLYRVEESGDIRFFASYDKPGQASLAAMNARFDELSKPMLGEGNFEFIHPVYVSDTVIGYVYVRVSAQRLTDMTRDTLLQSLLVLAVVLIVSLLITLRMQQSLTRPIESLVTLVQRIARQKDYSKRADASSISELNILANAFNLMLDRTQQYIKRQQEAEQEHHRLNASLEEKVNQRTLALKDANQELIETLEKLHQFQRQMVQNEKMASLGDMVAGVAHEVNTPIGLGVTASTMMLDRLEVLEKEFEAKSLKASTLQRFISEGNENLNIIYRNLNRAAELISSFKQVAVDQSSEDTRTFNFGKLIDEILLSMRPRLKKVNHKINVHCAEDLCIESKAGPINQIMINLIVNSIIHGFEFMEQGQIDISAEMVGSNKLKVTYEDNGKGIDESMRKRIFDPFVTTKRGQGGSGLGMHLVYNLVTQALNGSISLTSEEGQGVEFQIIFPVIQVDSDARSLR